MSDSLDISKNQSYRRNDPMTPVMALSAGGAAPSERSPEGIKRTGRLSLTKSDGTVRFFNIKRSIQIGRGAECDIRIKVKTVSRVHCKVRVEENGDFVLENVSSTNFTIVNKTEVSRTLVLHDGDTLTVAERDFVFQLVDPTISSSSSATGGIAVNLEDADVFLDERHSAPQSQQANAVETSETPWYSVFCASPDTGGSYTTSANGIRTYHKEESSCSMQ